MREREFIIVVITTTKGNIKRSRAKIFFTSRVKIFPLNYMMTMTSIDQLLLFANKTCGVLEKTIINGSNY